MADLIKVVAMQNQVRGEYEIHAAETQNLIASFSENDDGFRLLNACIAHLEQTGVEVDNRT